MLRKIRISLACVFFVLITLLFLDFTGCVGHYFGWMAKIQLLPAFLALNVVVVVALLLLTLLFGRIYCSVICPMGVMQDFFSWLGGKVWRNRFHYVPARPWIRWGVFVVFVALMIFGLNAVAVLIAPYSAFGRIASNLFAPFYDWVNNLCADVAARHDSVAFHHVEVAVRGGLVLFVALVTFLLVGVLSFRWGRLWCNNICPVGTFLGFFSKFSLFRPILDATKCIGCSKCARNCKAQCINLNDHTIDYSRCVSCMDCITHCSQGAIRYRLRSRQQSLSNQQNADRRKFLVTAAAVTAGASLLAQEKRVDGGLAVMLDRQVPKRNTQVKPFGAYSVEHFAQHCTSCQLCVSECPNGVLRPSRQIETLLQPEMGFDKGFCRPECTRCSEVCPTGAIRRITPAEKSAIHVGVAVWLPQNCIANKEGVHCDNCARHCPVGAIQMIPKDPNADPELPITLKIPAINETRCIGCGACEYLCPARPQGAIFVEGRPVHVVD